MQPEARRGRTLVDRSDLPQLNLRREWTPLIWALCLVVAAALAVFGVVSTMSGPLLNRLVAVAVPALLLTLDISALRHLRKGNFSIAVQLWWPFCCPP